MYAPFGIELEDDTECLDNDEEDDEIQVEDDNRLECEPQDLEEPIFGIGEGPALDLEDYATIEINRDGKGQFDLFVDIDGKKVSKPQALQELWKALISSLLGSTDCLG